MSEEENVTKTDQEEGKAPATEPKATTEVVADDPVAAKLVELGVDADVITLIKNDLGVLTVDDLGVLTVEDYLGVGVKAVQARKLAAEFAPVATAVETAALSSAAINVLPKPSDDESWLETLKATGILKVDEATYAAATRVALATRVGLFDIPEKIMAEMDAFASVAEEPFTIEYYTLRDLVTRVNYSDVFASIPGVSGQYATKGRKNELVRRINEFLWPSIGGFYSQLQSWQEKWLSTSMNPQILPMLIMSGGKAMPPGLMAAPDTGSIRDAAEEVINTINRVFAGDGVIITAALAQEARQIKQTLDNRGLPAMMGLANRELMLKKLGVAVSPMDPRLETNLATFVVSIVKLKDQPAGDAELAYLTSLFQLGSDITWDQLGVGAVRGYTAVDGRKTQGDL